MFSELHNEKTGGPAFPAMEVRTADTGDIVSNASQGMNLRDYFAGQALQGYLSTNKGQSYQDYTLARHAYAVADAMLEARGEAR